jgi:hypothetical protein
VPREAQGRDACSAALLRMLARQAAYDTAFRQEASSTAALSSGAFQPLRRHRRSRCSPGSTGRVVRDLHGRLLFRLRKPARPSTTERLRSIDASVMWDRPPGHGFIVRSLGDADHICAGTADSRLMATAHDADKQCMPLQWMLLNPALRVRAGFGSCTACTFAAPLVHELRGASK